MIFYDVNIDGGKHAKSSGINDIVGIYMILYDSL
jgi:hypothetical protein